MKWIKVEDELPVIPEGHYAVSVLMAVFDEIFEKINPGNGLDVMDGMYGRTDKLEHFNKKEGFDFMVMYIGNNTTWGPVCDKVTHWMYYPEPPKYKYENGELIYED